MVDNTPKMIEAATNSGRIETESRHRIHSRFKKASHILNMLAYAGCALKEMESDGLAAHIREPSRVK